MKARITLVKSPHHGYKAEVKGLFGWKRLYPTSELYRESGLFPFSSGARNIIEEYFKSKHTEPNGGIRFYGYDPDQEVNEFTIGYLSIDYGWL